MHEGFTKPNSHCDQHESTNLLASLWHALSHPLTSLWYGRSKVSSFTDEAYPHKQNRYFALGWNSNYQYCYTEDEKNLIHNLIKEYSHDKDLFNSDYFTLNEEQRLHGWWSCISPENDIHAQSFTLPNRVAKDTNTFPLWEFATNAAKQIANWQSQRAKNQNENLMNDPTMLILEELKYWFFDTLATKGCDGETQALIVKKQSYLRQLLHKIPSFGPDQLHLLKIDRQLEFANSLLTDCHTLKKLPELLTDLTLKAKNLESTIANFLHFSLTNEEVDDNFIVNLELTSEHCAHSPVCKLFKAAQETEHLHGLKNMPIMNQFYLMREKFRGNDVIQYDLNLKEELLKDISFPNFITDADKREYLKTLALLSSLIRMREILEKYKNLQANLGTYVFTFHYRDITNDLANNYLALIEKTVQSVSAILSISTQGFATVLKDPGLAKRNQNFINNLRALNTFYSKDTTTKQQLLEHANIVKSSLSAYQEEMSNLILSIENGQAFEEIDAAMQELRKDIETFNQYLPAQLTNQPVEIKESKPLIERTQNSLAKNSNQALFDYGSWDTKIKRDPYTNKKIYTYRLYEQGNEIGFAEFYNVPYLCTDTTKHQHNIVRTGGTLANIKVDTLNINEICEYLPPTLFDKIVFTTIKNAAHGTLRGATNVLAVTLKNNGFETKYSDILSQVGFYSGVYMLNFIQYLAQIEVEDDLENAWHAAYQAAVNTGELLIVNAALESFSYITKQAGAYFFQNTWDNAGTFFAKAKDILSLGFFAYNSKDTFLQSVSGLVAGSAAQQLTEKTGKWLLTKK